MSSNVTPTLMALLVPHVPRGVSRPYPDTTLGRNLLVPDSQALFDNGLAGTCQAKHVDVVGAVSSFAVSPLRAIGRSAGAGSQRVSSAGKQPGQSRAIALGTAL